MITMQQALTAREFWHMTAKNADGTPVRCRRNGKTKTWKTRPGQFNVPVKRGLKECFNLTNSQAHEWCVPELWEAEHMIFEGVTP